MKKSCKISSFLLVLGCTWFVIVLYHKPFFNEENKLFAIAPCSRDGVEHNDMEHILKSKNGKNLTAEDLFAYFHWENKSSCQFSIPFGGAFLNLYDLLMRVGQKEICLDKGVGPTAGQCLVYSFGINNEWSFDEAMEDFGCQVFAFDPSMNVENHNHSKNIRFFRWRLSNKDEILMPSKWEMKTLSTIYRDFVSVHGNQSIDSLKIDMEFAEWNVLPQMIDSGILSKVKQLAVEIHFNGQDSIETYRKYFTTLRSLEEHGFIRFTSRPNPWLRSQVTILNRLDYTGYEMTWYNQNYSSKY